MTVFKHGDPVRMRAYALTPHTTGTVTGTTPEGRVLVRWDDNHAITEQVPQYLEPLGEPMSTETRFTGTYDVALVIESDTRTIVGFKIEDDGAEYSVDIHDFDIPNVIKAILEAAGVEPLSEHYGASADPKTSLRHAAHYINKHIEARDEAAKEAADRAELEAEALELYRCTVPFTEPVWGGMTTNSQQAWVEVARKAREMHNR